MKYLNAMHTWTNDAMLNSLKHNILNIVEKKYGKIMAGDESI